MPDEMTPTPKPSPDNRKVSGENLDVAIGVINERTLYILQELRELKAQSVTRREFTPVRLIAYGLVSTLGVGFAALFVWLLQQAAGG